MDLDAARGVLVVWVVAYAKDCGIHRGAAVGRGRGGVFEVLDCVRGGLGWYGLVVGSGGHAGRCGGGWDSGVVERAEAVVDA